MRLRIAGGRVIDPANDVDGIGDVWVGDGRIVAAPEDGRADETIDARGCVIMAGAIDIHTHVAGANVATAKLLLPERYRHLEDRPAYAGVPLDAALTGKLYAEMGYTLVVEPAMAPTDAVAVHAELEAIPYVDRAALVVLGNDDTLLSLVRDRAGDEAVADYVGYMVTISRALGVKAINPGGAAAFKADARRFDLDDVVPEWGVTARGISAALRAAIAAVGIPHPLHLHTCNLGLPGNAATAVATIEAAEGEPVHLAHLQFYGYGTEGALGVSSGAARIGEALARHPNVTADIGQVVFGPTVTVSSDVLTQFNARRWARPRKWVVRDGDANGGGIIPYAYRRRDTMNALQWAIGLELFLLIEDPWRVFLTTDHPNGGPFTAYPDLIALLMDREARRAVFEDLPAATRETALLGGLSREYSLAEIAIMTRAAPARLLGLADRGHLGEGAVADVAVYRDEPDRAAMFRNARHVLKDGVPIVRDGRLLSPRPGRTLCAAPPHDPAIRRLIAPLTERRWGLPPEAFAVPETILREASPFEVVPCRT